MARLYAKDDDETIETVSLADTEASDPLGSPGGGGKAFGPAADLLGPELLGRPRDLSAMTEAAALELMGTQWPSKPQGLTAVVLAVPFDLLRKRKVRPFEDLLRSPLWL